jgi:hypothetical protein
MTRGFQKATATVIVTLMLGFVFTLVMVSRADAEVTRGSCVGQAEFPSKASDRVLSADRPVSEVFTVPKQDTVLYTGAVSENAQPFNEPVQFEGGIILHLPRTTWQVVGWGGVSEHASADGTYTYEVPSFVPAGTGSFELTAWHKQRDVDCEVTVAVSLDGKPGPAALIAVAGTVVFGAGVIAAGVKKGAKG